MNELNESRKRMIYFCMNHTLIGGFCGRGGWWWLATAAVALAVAAAVVDGRP